MKQPTLTYWTDIWDNLANSETTPCIRLTTEKMFYGLFCTITPDGNIKLTTSTGGGHGEGRNSDAGHTAKEWLNLIMEADSIRKYYWENKQST